MEDLLYNNIMVVELGAEELHFVYSLKKNYVFFRHKLFLIKYTDKSLK